MGIGYFCLFVCLERNIDCWSYVFMGLGTLWLRLFHKIRLPADYQFPMVFYIHQSQNRCKNIMVISERHQYVLDWNVNIAMIRHALPSFVLNIKSIVSSTVFYHWHQLWVYRTSKFLGNNNKFHLLKFLLRFHLLLSTARRTYR